MYKIIKKDKYIEGNSWVLGHLKQCNCNMCENIVWHLKKHAPLQPCMSSSFYRQYNLSHRMTNVQLSESELDQRVQEVIGANEQMGARSVWSALRATGIRVQRDRVRESLIRVSPAGAAQRALSHRLHRRTYRVAGPNSLWHLDGNHKLIR